jgi:hypothetical protein
VAKPDFKIVEYELWAASTVLGLLALMRRHVFKFSSRPFPAILGPARGGHLQATGGARHHYKYGSIAVSLAGGVNLLQ